MIHKTECGRCKIVFFTRNKNRRYCRQCARALKYSAERLNSGGLVLELVRRGA